MKTAITIAGWAFAALFFVVAVGVGFLAIHQRKVHEMELAAKSSALAQMEDILDSEKEARARLGSEAADLRQRIDTLNAQIDAMNAKSEDQTADAATESEQSMQQQMAGLLQGLTAGEDGEKTDFGDVMKSMQKLLQSDEGKGMMDMGVQMQMNQMYGDLFATLGLSPEKEQEVRAILADYMRTEMQRGMAMWDKDSRPSKEEMLAQTEVMKADLNNKLAAVLDAQQLKVVEDYNTELPQHMMEKNFDLQLSMFGDSIPQEVRTDVRQVLVEEFTSQMPVDGMAAMQADPQSAIEMQLGAFERARERLSAAYDAETYAPIDRFLQQQEEMMQSAMSMFNNTDAPK